MDSCQTLVMFVSCRADELIRFWGHEVKGQRSQGSLCMQKQLVIALSEEPIDGFLPIFSHRYEVAGGIMFSGCPSVKGPYVRTSRSRDRVIWRTDWWIPAKL